MLRTEGWMWRWSRLLTQGENLVRRELVLAGIDHVGWDRYSGDPGVENGGIKVGPVRPIE